MVGEEGPLQQIGSFPPPQHNLNLESVSDKDERGENEEQACQEDDL